jgi:hypothetical protein
VRENMIMLKKTQYIKSVNRLTAKELRTFLAETSAPNNADFSVTESNYKFTMKLEWTDTRETKN